MKPYIDIVFDGPPGPNAQGHHCNFVETESPAGTGFGGPGTEWIQDGDFWRLRITPEAFA